MPIVLSHNAANALLKEAYEQMVKDRKSKGAKSIRAVRYEWQYRGGKKKAAKLGAGVAIGAGVAVVVGATQGIGAPIVIPLAAGGLALGMANDTAFAKLWDRDKRGSESTRDWIQNYAKATTAKATKKVEVRAHKVIRRAFQHYLTAWLKAQPLRGQWLTKDITCALAVQKVTEILHIVHHLEKARLYLHPAIYLSRDLLDDYEALRNGCDEHLGRVHTRRWHQDDKPCKAGRCYSGKNEIFPRDAIDLWKPEKVNHNKGELDTAKKHIRKETFLALDPLVDAVAYPVYLYAKNNYDRNIGTKVWHGVTNDWERKTVAERNAFVAKRAVSLIISASSAAMAVGAEAVLQGFGPLVDIAADFVDQTVEAAPDQIDIGGKPLDNIGTGRGAAEAGAAAQDSLRGAAIHILEIYRNRISTGSLTWDEMTTCDDMVLYCRYLYESQYHLQKVEKYLQEAIEKVTKLADKIHEEINHLINCSTAVVRWLELNTHEYCKPSECLCQVDHNRPDLPVEI